MMAIGVHIDYCKGVRDFYCLYPNSTNAWVKFGVNLFGAFQGVYLGSHSSMSGTLQDEHESGNHFHAFQSRFVVFQDRAATSVLMGLVKGMRHSLKLTGGIGTVILVGVQHPGTQKLS